MGILFGCRYDFILRTETMFHDAPHILTLLDRDISYLVSSQKNVRNDSQETDKISHSKMLDILKYVSNEDKVKLKRRYSQDLELFGYTYDINTNMIDCLIDNDDKCC